MLLEMVKYSKNSHVQFGKKKHTIFSFEAEMSNAMLYNIIAILLNVQYSDITIDCPVSGKGQVL